MTDYLNHDRWGNPVFPHPETGIEQSWTRCTTVSKALEDSGGLINWTGAMVAGGAYLRSDLIGQIGARWPMTDDNKSDIYKLVGELKDAGGGSVGRNKGDTLHEMLRRINQGDEFTPMPPWDADIAATLDLQARAGISVDRRWVERTVCLPEFGVAGSFDFCSGVADWPTDELVISDYKTGKIGDYSWPSWVTQLTLYANAPLIWDWNRNEFLEMPPVSKTRAFVVHVPAGTGKADLYVVDISGGMRAVRAALWVRDWRKQAKTLARKARLTTKASA